MILDRKFKGELSMLFKSAMALLFISTTALANVSLRNGNFFIGYTDLIYTGGIAPKIERVYNNKSSYDGIFGFGYGSDFETYLSASPDGSMVLHENGGGAQNRFTSPKVSVKEVDVAVENILKAKTKIAGLTGGQADAERKKLRNDARYRNDEWERLYTKGLVQARKVANGSVFTSNKFGYQTLTKTNDGYVRRYDDGKVETFNDNGKLTRVADKNGNFVNISYDKAGHMVNIKDNLNRNIKLAYNRTGKVEKVEGDAGKAAEYKYNENELTYSKDVDGNEYEYKYSSNGRHNLVEIKYDDGKKLQIGYNEIAKGETVAWVKDKDGTLTEYEYGGNAQSILNYYTQVVTKGPDGKVLNKNKYEYWEKTKADGERYTQKMVTNIDGDVTETVYNESAGLPVSIKRNGKQTSFQYDRAGHVIKKETPTEVTELSYDSKASKVSKVVKYPRLAQGKKSAEVAEYQYDAKGNLIAAKNSAGKSVKLVYDLQGRIKALVDQNKQQLLFTYNEASRPVEINDPSIGKIKVRYTDAGEVEKVESTGGRAVASKVTSTFQTLMDLIRPAGVSLTF